MYIDPFGRAHKNSPRRKKKLVSKHKKFLKKIKLKPKKPMVPKKKMSGG